MNSHDFLSMLLTDGPLASRCELVRHLASDDFGPRMLARLRADDRAVTVRGIAIADAAWTRASRRLQRLAGVHSEHVTEMLAYGRHEGLAYFVHVQHGGPRLDTRLREHEGGLPLSTVLSIFGQLLAGVGLAHRRGVVVGGVRPQDVRLEPEGEGYRVRVRNFGLAAVLGVPAGRRGSTDHPSIYRAPELDVSECTACDVFSLGVLFVRMLTGPVPATADEAERHQVLRERIEGALHERVIDDGLATLLLEVVDPDISTRPRDANRLLEALLEVVPAADLGGPITPAQPAADQPAVAAPSAEATTPPQADRSWQEDSQQFTPRPTPRTMTERVAPLKGGTIRVHSLTRHPARSHRSVRLALVAGLSSVAAALTLALAVGEPGASPSTLPTTSLSSALASAKAEPAPAPAPEPAPEATTLVIDAEPPGALTIDGRSFGSTPVRAEVTPGPHVVRVQVEGHQTWRSRVELSAGQQQRLVASLVPLSPAP